MDDTSMSAGKVSRRRRSRLLVLAELAVIVGIFVGDRYLPVSKTPYLFSLAWISLRLRGLGWHDVGLARPRSWLTAIGIGVLAGAGMEALELLVTQPLLMKLTGRKPDFSDFFALHGNLKLLLVGLAFSWTLAAFGEEMVWRGYLMNRVASLIGHSRRIAWIASLIVVNAAFGVAHRYQGITGILDEALMGIVLGLIYLASRRNLTSVIVAHGVADTIDAFLFFIGHYPGT
jgi:membrane protease YdiL (CAAX protease family)